MEYHHQGPVVQSIVNLMTSKVEGVLARLDKVQEELLNYPRRGRQR